MLKIRPQQLDAFKKVEFDDFIKRMCESVKINFNLIENPPENLKEEVRLVIKEAEGYGFETEDTIEQYIYLKWKYPLFRTNPLPNDVMKIVTFPDREPEVIIDELIHYFEKEG